MWRLIYTLLFQLAIPAVLIRLWWRGKVERGYRHHIDERFGLAGDAAPKKNAVWIHAVSVGEVRAALPLVSLLGRVFPDSPILITCMTPTGRRTAQELFARNIDVRYMPYDLPWFLQRFVARIKPKVLIVMETELWPNLLAVCRQRHIPAFLVNARLSEKSQRGYLKFAPVRALAREALQSFAAVLAQSDIDAGRLAALGAKNVEVTGNMKFDLTLDSDAVARGIGWRNKLAGRNVILLASTRDNEEIALASAFKRVSDWPVRSIAGHIDSHHGRPLLVIVPRHPTRFDPVADLLQNAGFTVLRRSALTDDDGPGLAATFARADVLLGDSMGEMQSYVSMCDVAIIGGSFQPLGGQNLIEAAAIGKPIIMGPSSFNFNEVVKLATDANAMRTVANVAEAMSMARLLLGDADLMGKMGENARLFAASHGGATDRTAFAIRTFLASTGS